MTPSTSGTAASEGAPAGQLLGTVRLAGMLTLSCLISQTGQTTVTFAGELDIASADQAYGYVCGAIDARGGQVLLDVADLSFCDAPGLAALARMSRHARQAGSSLHLVAPPPRLRKIIRITGMEETLPVHRADVGSDVVLDPCTGRQGRAGMQRPGVAFSELIRASR
jgi:anti-anti-sigma factor